MSDVIYAGTGRIEKGQILVDADAMAKAAFKTRDCRITVTIERKRATRSGPQNDYYWAVVIPRIQEAFKTRGIEAGRNPDVTHEVLKSQFMDPELVRRGKIRGFVSDTGLLIGTHTPDLNKLEFIEYLERICDHAAEYWDTYIPPPDPQWREHAEREGDAA